MSFNNLLGNNTDFSWKSAVYIHLNNNKWKKMYS